MNRMHVIGLALAVVTAGCAYDSSGRRIRNGAARFDAKSVSSPKTVYTLEGDGSWAGLHGDRYERVGDQIRKVGAFSSTPSLIRPSGWVEIEHLPDGLVYTPSYYSTGIWTFVTEDGKPLPADIEVPLYLATQLGLGGQSVNVWKQADDDSAPELESGCGLVLLEIQGRHVAGWVSQQSAICPAPTYPARPTVATLNKRRGEVWESPARPGPW